MIVKTEIKTCLKCKHIKFAWDNIKREHIYICTHYGAYPPKGTKNRFDKTHRLIKNIGKIPEFCPLKKGYMY